MTEVKKIATRASYGAALTELGAHHDDLIVFDADLSNATKTDTFKKVFPGRYFNCGIAEGNMMAVAAGAAAMGLVPFASSFAMFVAGRAFEQVRNSIGYPHLNVKIGATHGGISVGEDGASHQCCEDFVLMRSIPGMVVMSPADDERPGRWFRPPTSIRGRSTCGSVGLPLQCSMMEPAFGLKSEKASSFRTGLILPLSLTACWSMKPWRQAGR